jgi:nicotinate-nucleotide pyrophosphorylase (carboxylating)
MLTRNPQVRRIVRLALDEDVGTGDVTTATVVPAGARVVGEVVAKEDGVLAGLPVAQVVLDEVDPAIACEVLVPDGTRVHPGMKVLRVRGPASSVLVAERTLLNFVMRLSGVATATRRFVDAMAGSGTIVLDTRKTTPGLRVLEKYAVRVGGGRNHRMALDGGVLIKNNHIAIRRGDLAGTIRAARAAAPSLCGIEAEVRTVEEARQAVEAGADVLLLDHMDAAQVAEVRSLAGGRARLEVSGNMTVDRAPEIAALGVDFVSAGALTHHAAWLDFAMYLRPEADSDGRA